MLPHRRLTPGASRSACTRHGLNISAIALLRQTADGCRGRRSYFGIGAAREECYGEVATTGNRICSGSWTESMAVAGLKPNMKPISESKACQGIAGTHDNPIPHTEKVNNNEELGGIELLNLDRILYNQTTIYSKPLRNSFVEQNLGPMEMLKMQCGNSLHLSLRNGSTKIADKRPTNTRGVRLAEKFTCNSIPVERATLTPLVRHTQVTTLPRHTRGLTRRDSICH
ncbi:hypothetical protein EVAR_10915_1 [Eumeta japonica]|uniref:Uncharacterized protein n=1 Tax=Eumeta variegata TaxID=151549 RepID=A0A4C1U634_EUMVA|nr:hypothetical protein EVAR_10915_1 [Eumeta japonica]